MPINSFEHYPMSWKPDLSNATSPLYKALAQKLEEDIKSGLLHPGDLLPPQRELADFLDLNLSTISKAFKLCSQKGLISSSIGKGTYIATDVQVNATLLDPVKAIGLIEMGAIHPTYDFNPSIQNVISNFMKSKSATSCLEYSAPCGSAYQKNTGTYWLKLAGLDVPAEHILLSNGGQNALCAILSSLFEAGDRIGTDPLIYAGIKTLAKMLGIQLVPIPSESNAMSAELLEQYCKNEGLKGIYLIPDFQNPTTHTMSLTRRQEIAQVAKKYKLIVIEDAINSLLNEAPLPPLAKLLPDQTIYISSLSKVLCPGMQIAFIYTPLIYKTKLESGLYNTNLMVSPLNAAIACTLIHSPLHQEILSKRRELTIARNHLVNSVLSQYKILGDPNCNFRLLYLPEGWTGKSFELCARNAGVQVYCGERFAVGGSPVPPTIRLSITTPRTMSELEKALHILNKLLQFNDDFTML